MKSDPAHAVFVETFALGNDGLRVGIKDSIDVAGHATRLASRAFASAAPAARHAEVVRALLASGCRIVGKTNMHELAYGVTGINQWTGTPVNPVMPDRIPGGSSSGSAVAVALGLVDFAIGTDTGGSIRIPAACCGVYGFKPSYGRISRAGVHPTVSSLDCVGPFARDLPMLETSLRLMDPMFVAQSAPATLRLARVDVTAQPAITAAVRGALAHPSIAVSTVTLPLLQQAFDAHLVIIGAENWSAYGYLTEDGAAEGEGDSLGADVRARLLARRDTSSEQLAAAEAMRAAFRSQVDAALAEVDALVLPTLPGLPLTLDTARDAGAAVGITTFVRPFNLSGHPAMTLPISTAEGATLALQLVGHRGKDEVLCAVARALLEAHADDARAQGRIVT